MAKSFSPLGGDTVSPLNAPPVHMGLLTKLNLLAIGLIVATALGIAAFLIGQQIRDEEGRLTPDAAASYWLWRIAFPARNFSARSRSPRSRSSSVDDRRNSASCAWI